MNSGRMQEAYMKEHREGPKANNGAVPDDGSGAEKSATEARQAMVVFDTKRKQRWFLTLAAVLAVIFVVAVVVAGS